MACPTGGIVHNHLADLVHLQRVEVGSNEEEGHGGGRHGDRDEHSGQSPCVAKYNKCNIQLPIHNLVTYSIINGEMSLHCIECLTSMT